MDKSELLQIETLFSSTFTRFKAELEEGFRRQIGVFAEDVQHRFDILAEGQQMLTEKLEETRLELNAEIAKVDQRVTSVAADLAEHRRDTEAHPRYQVREE
ncbi:MAG: hypothetical protein GXY54_06365 [Deltaproteobacteria bacterium]|nr:hypothetical protein [Deltaproteobacteria bacterium]